jgi:hemoglobin
MRMLRCLLFGLVLATAVARPVRADDTLYQQLGQRAGLVRIVDTLSDLYMTDPRIKGDFDNINLDYLKPRLVDYLCVVAGGPCHYRGRSMAASHKGLKLNRAKFDALTEDLQTALDREHIPYWTQNRLIARLAPLQRDIVTR